MKISEFNALAQAGYRYIPVTRQVLADVETPVSVYAKLANDTYSYLFESVQGGEKWARYSMIGLACRKVFEFSGHDLRVHENGQCVETQTVSDPLAFIDQYRDSLKVADVLDAQVLSLAPSMKSLPTFQGGLVGYFAYDTVRYVEHRLASTCPKDALGLPDIVLMQSEEVVVFDNLAGSLTLMVLAQVEDGLDEISNAAQLAKAQARLDELQAKLSHQANLRSIDLSTQTSQKATVDEARFTSSFGQDNFYKAVNRIKDYVLDGDTMQVVISQRLSVDFDQSPLDLYRALRSLNPSPYMYLVNLGETHIVGSSPEVLVRSEQSTVTVRPIAGTRRRGLDEAEDIALEKELLADPKEIAEHLMLIDLGRNDVGRIAKTGSVDVTEQMQIERYSHVMHIVSNVQGELDDDFSALDALKATLPAGTLSGAPKVRAMEIIDELEPVKRGIYGGAVGYLAYNGDMDTAIAIRTAVIHKGQLHVQAGAGVVADSVPELEWKETMNKARALFRAVAMLDDNHDAGGVA